MGRAAFNKGRRERPPETPNRILLFFIIFVCMDPLSATLLVGTEQSKCIIKTRIFVLQILYTRLLLLPSKGRQIHW